MAEQSIRFGIKGEDGKISLRWKCLAPKNVGKNDVYLSMTANDGWIFLKQ